MAFDPLYDRALTRRDALTIGGAGLLGGALGTGRVIGARAAEQAPIGTWPAGVSGNTAFIGISVPRTGTYAVPGEDELKGYQLAIEHVNAGHGLIRQMAPKVTKGLLGKQVVFGVADSQANPSVAVQNLSRFTSTNKAIMLTGSCSSAEAVADNKFGQREKVIYLPGVSGSMIRPGRIACATPSVPASTARPPRPRLARSSSRTWGGTKKSPT